MANGPSACIECNRWRWLVCYCRGYTAAWCAADAEPSYYFVAALDRDPARNGCNIGKAEKRRASACLIFADGLGKGACPVDTEDGPHCHHGIGYAESLVWMVLH